MQVIYYLDGKKFVTSHSNNDVTIEEKIVDNRKTITLTALKKITLGKAKEVENSHVNFSDRYFLNGYQSWTDSHEYKLAKRLRNIKKSPHIITALYALRSYGDSLFYNYSIKKSHGYDFFYQRGKFESFVINLNYENAYLIIELIKDSKNLYLTSDVENIDLKANQSLVIFDYLLFDSYEKGLAAFKDTFPKKSIEKVFGYTSWYNYFQNINEEIINRDLDALDERFNLFQIDDGYETYVGDWLDVDSKKFPNGLAPIVKKIHDKGYKAGIWLAPFVAETKSKLFNEHKDWFKCKNGKPFKAGGNWSGQYALDLDKKEVREYIEKCLRHYMDMGFDFFKLDFLYAVGLFPSKGKSRCQTQREAYKFLREILQDKLILGCGANIANSIDVFDYMRVGPDVSLEFDDVYYMRLFHRERVSTKVTIQNTIYRSLFDQRLFANDPDVFLLRDENIKMSKEQRKALIKINALFGSVLMTSDDIALYDYEKKQLLSNALTIYKHGRVTHFETQDNSIIVTYEISSDVYKLSYNTKKGILEYDRQISSSVW